MDKSEVSNAEEIKNMLKVRNELGGGNINNFIKWVVQWKQVMENVIRSRNALGWGKINEFIKRENPGGFRPSLLR